MWSTCTLAPRSQISTIWCDALRLDEGVADDHLGRVAAFLLDDVELLDARDW